MIHQGKISAQVLKSHLEQEIKLYQQYIDLLNQEKGSITKFDADKVEQFTEKRDSLFNAIKIILVKRVEYIKILTGVEKTKLTDAIRSNYKGTEGKLLMQLAKRLKDVTVKMKKQGQEINQIVNFGLNVVNGTLSIYMSATQNVTRSYSRKGMVKEAFNPQGDRHSGVIKEA